MCAILESKAVRKFFAILLSFNLIWFRFIEADAVAFNYTICTCHQCENSFDKGYLDDYGRPRQYGIKLCASHKNEKSINASFYKRGYADYNCLAYALKVNSPNAWYWPSEWGSSPSLSLVERFLAQKGYDYSFPPNDTSHAGGDIIYVYGTSKNCVTHFARRTNLGGNYVSGAATISKWGIGSLYKSSSVSPYEKESDYGELLAVCAEYYYDYSTK